jgi:REP element-mobilizing transposase RayT
MRTLRRIKNTKIQATYHAMSRIVGGQMLLEDREKEVLRKMLWQVADFCGVEVLTYSIMTNHFHVLVRVPEKDRGVSDVELLRRFNVLYPKPTKYQTASFLRLETALREDTEDAVKIREQLLARMHDLSEFMKTLKQRFSIWYNRNHDRRQGTLWMERFKSVLVEGAGNSLQTMAAYIDLNPVRAGLVEDPKDYRWCGYAETVAGSKAARIGLSVIWASHADGSQRIGDAANLAASLAAHRSLIFGKGASPWTHRGKLIDRKAAEKVLNEQQGELPMAAVLRCRVRYFTDGAILGSTEFVRSYAADWQTSRGRTHPVRAHPAHGAAWGDLAVVNAMRRDVFG